MHKRIVSALSAFTLSLTVLMFAGPAVAENVLRFTGIQSGADTMDPHSRWEPDNRLAVAQVYETLLDIDSNLIIVPQLALTWKPLNPTRWLFELRPDVIFHDGTPFTAADVLFSIERARAETSNVQGSVSNIAAVSAIDDHTVEIATAAPDPLLWMRLSNVAIMSKAWALAHGAGAPVKHNGGEETFATRHANGTGPFMLKEFEPDGRWIMVRNATWWGTTEYPHNIDRIVQTWVNDEERHLRALLDGEIDLLQAPLYSGLDEIRQHPHLKIVYRPKLYTAFFGFDQVSHQLRTSNVKGRNPFKDRRVRQALAHAIDLTAALRSVMGELFIPAGMLIAPGVNGYARQLDQPAPYDPDTAKRLLAEAGYPSGFSVTLDCPNDWGDDELTECAIAAQQLGRVGIEVSINFQPGDRVLAQVEQRHESDFFLDSWLSDPDSEGLLRDLFQSRSKYNLVGYANPRVDELIEKIKIEMVTYARDAYLAEAWQIVTEDIAYLPIRYGVSVFAMRKNLEIPPDPWDVPRFRLARFKEEGKSAQQ